MSLHPDTRLADPEQAVGGVTSWKPVLPPAERPPRRPGTRYEIQLRRGSAPATWETVTVVVGYGARKAIEAWWAAQSPADLSSDSLRMTVRAVPIHNITQISYEVEQRSTLTEVR